MDITTKQFRFSSLSDVLSFFDERDGCHIWKGSKSNGYGILNLNGKSYRAHRVSFENKFGKIPDGLFICHKCNVKDCINPDHLYAGTPADNARDRMEDLRKKELEGKLVIDENTYNHFMNDLMYKSNKMSIFFPRALYEKLKIMCILTHTNMSEFIRASVKEKISKLKGKNESPI